ncbi:MAG: hypothetical protein J6K76_07430 [Spirochaetaceae bacterium]|nr:hypothetical protein [Spirochaetaceae bacterium]
MDFLTQGLSLSSELFGLGLVEKRTMSFHGMQPSHGKGKTDAMVPRN